MALSPTRLVIPYGLMTLLEGASRAAMMTQPEDITDFFTLYFQGLTTFRREHPDLELPELVEYFKQVFLSDTVSEGVEEPSDTSVPCKDRQKVHKFTDTEEDQLLEEPDSQYSSTRPQHPSIRGSFAESTSPPASERAVSPVGAVLAYTPAEPAMLATDMLGNSSSCSVRHVATSVQTLPTTSQGSGGECTPEGGSEAASDISQLSVRDAATSVQSLHVGSAVGGASESDLTSSAESTEAETESEFPAAEGSVQSVRSCAEVCSVSSTAGDLRPPGSLAGSPAAAADEASKGPLWEEPSASPAPNDSFWALPPCSQGEVTSAAGVVSHPCLAPQATAVELPPYVEQFPRRILIPFVDQTAYLLERSPGLSLQAPQRVTTLVPSEDLGAHPEGAEPTAQVEPAEQACAFSAMASSAEQPQASPNVWTIYGLTNLSRDPTPTLPPGQALSLPRGGAQQLAAGAGPAYVMEEQSSMGTAPPFILVGSNLQSREHWNPLPNCAAFTQQDRGARRRFATIPVPVAAVAEEAPARAGPQCSSAEERAAKCRTPRVGTVAVPLAELMAARRGSQAGVEKRGCACRKSAGEDFP